MPKHARNASRKPPLEPVVITTARARRHAMPCWVIMAIASRSPEYPAPRVSQLAEMQGGGRGRTRTGSERSALGWPAEIHQIPMGALAPAAANRRPSRRTGERRAGRHDPSRRPGLQTAQHLSWRLEQLCTAARLFQIQVHVVFPGDRDAAVQLDALGRRGCSTPAMARSARWRRWCRARGRYDGLAAAMVSIQVGQCLRAWNRRSGGRNCTFGSGVPDGQLQAAFGGADLLGRQQDCCGVGDSDRGTKRLGL